MPRARKAWRTLGRPAVTPPSRNSSSALRPIEETGEKLPHSTKAVRKATDAGLRAAVHRARPLSRAGMLERMFTFAFSKLVYPQIWEDPVVDMKALEIGSGHEVIAIASGGCNVLSYLIADPAGVTAVDLSRAHVALGRLKLCALQTAVYATFYRFFGGADAQANLSVYDQDLRAKLDQETRAYWEGARLPAAGAFRCFRPQSLPPRPARPLHRSRPSVARLRRRLDDPCSGPLARGAARLLRDLSGAAVRQAARALGHGAAIVALRPRHSAGPICGARRARPTWRRCCATGSSSCPAISASTTIISPGRRSGAPIRDAVRPACRPISSASNFDDDPRSRRPGRSAQPLVHRISHAAAARSLDRYVLLDAQDWMSDLQLNDLWREITRTARPGARVIFRTAADEPAAGRVPDDRPGAWRYQADQSAT